MDGALALARRGLGRTAPNPAVGCILVRDGRVLGRGWTQPGGRPHAETEAIRRAEAADPDGARGATCYVTLEPCAHHGKTPPCVDALIAAGVSRVVAALEDPDPRVAGAGLARLRDAGVEVDTGVQAEAAAEVNAGYLLMRQQDRPLVTLKAATTLDGRIATHTGESRWITGEAARAQGHLLRARHDAIVVGSGTAVVDNPALTVRLPGMTEYGPRRVVLDGRLRLPLTHALVRDATEVPTLLMTRQDSPTDRLQAYRDAGVEIASLPTDSNGALSLTAALHELAVRGITRVLVEGGGQLAAGLLRYSLVDRLVWFRSARVVGGDGIPAIAGFGLDALADTPRFRLAGATSVGEDVMETYVAVA
ncbi:bifunctional diaminohydroxyphosphoribosylaminopyrimidine deaminase/5-amino-6-(5-phosphoribosylamino)uracil reductase RibD [Rhodovibrio salinarum]|uniref:Riboflavin biosynthesis protein RibD n=1 Tax=Rhodovibrio salinarum TaxID=1087 RepID=A0A934QJB1_9PROT|nr:bifunctional diaminohydroxyphosphoribosylaminopyrimidine deaminase/5-amino-6-(5-phosphoribosylamino)uracil reductase RibD [Rhodovibrio salinarum]MBK1697929.1 riboflavin biosynthesis protein RibD [Rhodovibrio salinarum]